MIIKKRSNYIAKCGYVDDAKDCKHCYPEPDIEISPQLRKFLTALDNRGSLYEKPYVNLNRGELTYDEFESIKDICKTKNKKGVKNANTNNKR